MRLITAHKILIASTIGFFVFFAGVEVQLYATGGTLANLAAAGSGLVAAVGFAVYLRAVIARQRRRARADT